MTYLNDTMNRICRGFCPLCNVCEQDHYCGDMMEIRKTIVKIMESGEILDG